MIVAGKSGEQNNKKMRRKEKRKQTAVSGWIRCHKPGRGSDRQNDGRERSAPFVARGCGLTVIPSGEASHKEKEEKVIIPCHQSINQSDASLNRFIGWADPDHQID